MVMTVASLLPFLDPIPCRICQAGDDQDGELLPHHFRLNYPHHFRLIVPLLGV